MTDSSLTPTPSNVYSFSRLKSFNQCPMQYRFRYLEGLKESFRSIESYLGNAVHDVLEWLYGERIRGSDPDEAAMLERFADRWQQGFDDTVVVIRIEENPETYLRLGREMLARFLRDTFARDRSETVSLEQRLSLRLSDDVVFTGFADRVGRTERGRLFVIDYKTSRSEGNDSEFSQGLQAPLYAVSVLQHHGEEEALAGYHYLRHGTTRWQKVDKARALRLVERFLELVGETEAARDFPARPGILCAWCGFNAVCPEADVPDRFAGGLRYAQGAGQEFRVKS
jgi:putative RecB family exonuclease